MKVIISNAPTFSIEELSEDEILMLTFVLGNTKGGGLVPLYDALLAMLQNEGIMEGSRHIDSEEEVIDEDALLNEFRAEPIQDDDE